MLQRSLDPLSNNGYESIALQLEVGLHPFTPGLVQFADAVVAADVRAAAMTHESA